MEASNCLLSKLLDMTVHRQVNVHHKHINIASNFSAKLCEIRFEIKNLMFLVLDSASFYKKGKSLHLAYHIFDRCKKVKNKNLNFR